jgi:hypothetical protein
MVRPCAPAAPGIFIMWPSPALCAYDWSDWGEYLINFMWPGVKRIVAKEGENPAAVAERLPARTKLLLVHLDISSDRPFISDAGTAGSRFFMLIRG